MVLCVAQDKSWTEFAAMSDHLITVFPLNTALGMFSEARDDQDVADEIIRLWTEGSQHDFEAAIRDAVLDRLSYVDFDVEAECAVQYEFEPMEAELLEIQRDTLSNLTVLDADDETVTFSFNIEIKGKFGASFVFSVWDSIDKEDVPMGSEYAEATDEVSLSLTIVAYRDVSDGVRHDEISVSQKQFSVDFGYVEAFPAEDPDEDDY